ncbi:MAG: hypothetical protein EOS78_02515 [Mesorhizobium sp.]|nr:MAG: hypothetical protein EOS78_02515 [Mesorhizobium sp.]TJX78255.1 MAG: hypothetical protein E5W21_02475 [Mesorhizobium sp.]
MTKRSSERTSTDWLSGASTPENLETGPVPPRMLALARKLQAAIDERNRQMEADADVKKGK